MDDRAELGGRSAHHDRRSRGPRAGGLQRTDEERPYPHGVYGTPNWYTNRSPERRRAWTDRDLDKAHVWRSYDYPHVIMLYYHMYEIAMMYPQLSNYLDAAGYLERAYQTAKAFYVYPYEIYPEYYETYKWGLYNELIVLELIVFTLENRTGDAHETELFLHLPYGAEYGCCRTARPSKWSPPATGTTHGGRSSA